MAATRLGVYFLEKDNSNTPAQVGATQAAIGLYSAYGPSDKAYLCRAVSDVLRLVGRPHEKLLLKSGVYDYGRGIQNAINFINAGIPVWIKRAVPASFTPATANVFTDASAHNIVATALGYGAWYNDLRVVIRGINYVTRKIKASSLSTTVPVVLEDVVLPRSVTMAEVDNLSNPVDDEGHTVGAATQTLAIGTTNIIITYQNSNFEGKTTMVYTGVAPTKDYNLSYQRTNTSGAVRLYFTTAAELAKVDPQGNSIANPDSNYLESYLVSFSEDGKDDAGNNIFIENVINEKSELVTVALGSAFVQSVLPAATTPSDLATGAKAFSGATTNDYADADGDMVTAYDEFTKKVYDILYVFDAGYSDAVKKKIALVCKNRLFPHGYIDPPAAFFIENGNRLLSTIKGTESQLVDDLVEWRMGLNMGDEQEFVSLAGSTWGLITDQYNGSRKLWMPPSFEVGYNAIVVDETQGAWKGILGPRRGQTRFEKLAINLYDYRNSLDVKQVNCLITDERGIQMYYGDSTMKVAQSQMQNTHARKTRSRLSREYYFTALDFVGEDMDAASFNDLQDKFETITAAYGDALESYQIVAGPPKTTADNIANAKWRASVSLIFKGLAKEIEITTTVFRNGTDLSVVTI